MLVGASILAACGSRSDEGPALAFSQLSPAGSGIFRVGQDGCCLDRVTHPPPGSVDSAPAWSPDGKRIAFIRGSRRTNTHHLYVIDANGGDARPIPGVAADNDGLSWSPDGKRIVFVARDGLRTASPTGHGTALLVRIRGASSPSWSPDGKAIVFATAAIGGPAVYVADAHGSNARALTTADFPTVVRSPVWSPDGRQIAFVEGNMLEASTFRPRLEIVRTNGKRVRTVTRLEPGADTVTTLAWSPDGKRFVISTMRADTSGLFTVAVRGGTPRLLLKGVVGDPSFSLTR